MRHILCFILCFLCFAPSAFSAEQKVEVQMLESITNPTVKSALAAWQGNDLAAWLSHFTPDAQLYDDGRPRDFKRFSNEIGTEWFTSIDKVENDGLDIYGKFHTEKWGDFKVYFKFHLNDEGKFNRLDIGQVSY